MGLALSLVAGCGARPDDEAESTVRWPASSDTSAMLGVIEWKATGSGDKIDLLGLRPSDSGPVVALHARMVRTDGRLTVETMWPDSWHMDVTRDGVTREGGEIPQGTAVALSQAVLDMPQPSHAPKETVGAQSVRMTASDRATLVDPNAECAFRLVKSDRTSLVRSVEDVLQSSATAANAVCANDACRDAKGADENWKTCMQYLEKELGCDPLYATRVNELFQKARQGCAERGGAKPPPPPDTTGACCLCVNLGSRSHWYKTVEERSTRSACGAEPGSGREFFSWATKCPSSFPFGISGSCPTQGPPPANVNCYANGGGCMPPAVCGERGGQWVDHACIPEP